jgi:glycerol transport system permease protein
MKKVLLGAYLVFLLLPLYWLLALSFKTTHEITKDFAVYPKDFTVANYINLFTSEAQLWKAFVDQGIYVSLNAVVAVLIALPAAYAFSRFRFLGDKHLFFWLLSNRMAPGMVFALPFVHLFGNLGLRDTHVAVALAHLLFNVPLAVWILEGFISSVPRQLDETAYLEGQSFPRFFIRVLTPLIAPGIGVALFFCFMYSWIEAVLVAALTTSKVSTIGRILGTTIDPSSVDYGMIAAMGTISILPGVLVLWFVRNHIARGFAMGRV